MISGYAHIAEPMIALMREDAPFVWYADCQESCDCLKQRLISAPVLVLSDFEKPFAVHTCDVGLGAALTQTSEDGLESAVAEGVPGDLCSGTLPSFRL